MIKDIVTALCKERGINVVTLEKKLGLGGGAISRWDKSDPGISRVKKVADYFGITVNDLLGYPEAEAPSIKEQQLLRLFRSLNEDGQEKALEYIQDIAPRYIKNQSSERLEEEA